MFLFTECCLRFIEHFTCMCTSFTLKSFAILCMYAAVKTECGFEICVVKKTEHNIADVNYKLTCTCILYLTTQ